MKIINDFEAAVRNHEMRGAAHPEDIPEIEKEFEKTKSRLEFYIKRLLKQKAGKDSV